MESSAEVLLRLVRYNAWANERMFAAGRALDSAALAEPAPGTAGSVEETVKHLVGVEDVYLAMLEGRDPAGTFESRETYFAHDLAWFEERARVVAAGFARILAERTTGWEEERLQVPWFSFPITCLDGLLQALTHSMQHRTQTLSVIGARGLAVPEIDYVVMVGESAPRSEGS